MLERTIGNRSNGSAVLEQRALRFADQPELRAERLGVFHPPGGPRHQNLRRSRFDGRRRK